MEAYKKENDMLRFLTIALVIISLFAFAIIFSSIGFGQGKRRGYVDAHLEVAKECERLGKFFVNEKVFVCHLKK